MTEYNEKLNLLAEAKKAYYEGNPIMGDEEYDALERELGLENKTDVGAHSENYTVRHPFLMGSLSKIQVKNDDGKTWDDYMKEIRKYITSDFCWVTPKYDGCSFELVIDRDCNPISVSTRGDGSWGKDIYKHVKHQVDEYLRGLRENFIDFIGAGAVIRGEVLVTKSDFEKYLSETYVNPRAFVAGSLNNDDVQETDKYLKLVMYEFRSPKGEFEASNEFRVDNFVPLEEVWYMDDFEKLYRSMEKIRETIDYPLDGFVLKTPRSLRSADFVERPKDCVAIKFAPEIRETVVESIEWNLSPKTSEYFPVGIVREIVMDSKKITRVSLSNYGNILSRGCGIGSKIRVSMAGDIIPFVYAIDEPSRDLGELPENVRISGVHLYKELTEDEKRKASFLASADVLGVKGLGLAVAEKLWNAQPMCSHLFEFDFDVYARTIDKKSSYNIRDAFRKFVSEMSLAQVIESLAIPFCGTRMSRECAAEILEPGSGDFTSMARDGYSWVFGELSETKYRLFELLRLLDRYGYDVSHVTAKPEKKSTNKIKVILTGSPKPHYATKAEFLAAHPEYKETSSWSECALLVCDDLSSTSSKMNKARKLNIQITTYA